MDLSIVRDHLRIVVDYPEFYIKPNTHQLFKKQALHKKKESYGCGLLDQVKVFRNYFIHRSDVVRNMASITNRWKKKIQIKKKLLLSSNLQTHDI